MPWIIKIKETAQRQLARLDPQTRNRIIHFLHEHIMGCTDPRHTGKALRMNMKGLWRYRVGDYRIICQLQNETVTVMVLEIGNRREIYRKH